MRAPDFWWAPAPGLAAQLLRPAGAVYGALTARRMARPGLVLPVPVLCVGNLVAGGAGKTPVALALAAMLRTQGHRPAFLSRGYGRQMRDTDTHAVVRVDPAVHDASRVGDEPLLLAAAAPTYVAADRRASGRQAIADGATVVVLDDGLQNPLLKKTVTMAVVDGATGLGNGLCVPAGPLRAPAERQWPFVQALCLIGEGAAGDAVASVAQARGTPLLRAVLRPDPATVASLRNRPLLAFAGIGRPEKFFATLDACGLEVRERRAFPDHHRFSAAERTGLLADAAAAGAQLVTTAKDSTRLPPGFPATALAVTLDFQVPDRVRDLLGRSLPLGAG